MMKRAIVLLPFLIFFGAWSVLTGAGAVLATMPEGQQAMRSFTGWLPDDVAAHIGSPTYWALLLLPFAVVPAAGLVGYRMTRSAAPNARADISSTSLLLLSATGFLYCFWTLYSIGHWVPGLLFEELSYPAFIARRVAIIEAAGFLFYAVVYAILPMCSALFLAKLLRTWTWVDFVGLLGTFAACYYLTFSIYMKLPLVIYFGMMGLAVIFSRRGWLLLPVIAVAAVGTFLSLQSLIGGFYVEGDQVDTPKPEVAAQAPKPAPAPASPNIDDKPKPAPPAPHEAESPSGEPKNVKTVPPKPEAPALPTGPKISDFSWAARYAWAAKSTAESVIFRMGSAYPFYVAVFADPRERCGIETNSLPLLPAPSCVLPRKIFDAMYPSVTWVGGFAPAAAHVSAYGEAGLAYSVLILIVVGLTLGAGSALIATGSGPAFVGIGIAVSLLAYYFTQVPFLGALTYAHGFAFFVLPAVISARQIILGGDVDRRKRTSAPRSA
ncbi:hypothetical protein [Nitratireductor sp. StC3]|uniref:hypothetical protein n=1 Tax=Nitratireductor sp. StC3 TaxID=2126741 RepID=UPI000D0D56C2|nr:hypothetical protein [Nitratireductor sp. StC3]PSM17077.1 hypothetical protein C7T96_16395 [Nitratireductor sp. StC3]